MTLTNDEMYLMLAADQMWQEFDNMLEEIVVGGPQKDLVMVLHEVLEAGISGPWVMEEMKIKAHQYWRVYMYPEVDIIIRLQEILYRWTYDNGDTQS